MPSCPIRVNIIKCQTGSFEKPYKMRKRNEDGLYKMFFNFEDQFVFMKWELVFHFIKQLVDLFIS